MEYDEFLKLAEDRRSVRRFKPDPVPEELVYKVIEAARFAPSGANSQPWEFVIIREQATKDRLAAIALNYLELSHDVELTRPEELRWPSAARPATEPGWKHAPVLVLVCGDPRVSKSFPLLTYLERGTSHLISGLASAVVYMTLAATSLGLGAHWISLVGAGYPSGLVKDLLGIPEDFVVYDMLGLGYPDEQPKPRLVRPREAMVHHDRFETGKYRSDEQIRDYLISLRSPAKA